MNLISRYSQERGARRPLASKRVVITRAAHQAEALADLLRARGAEPLLYPCIAIAPPEETGELDIALYDLVNGRYDWLVLTSANTVHILAERLSRLPDFFAYSPMQGTGAKTIFSRLKVAAVGRATAEAAQRLLRLVVDCVPERHQGATLAEVIMPRSGMHILLPQAEAASTELVRALRVQGAIVTTVTAYRTVIGSGGVDVPGMLALGAVDAITFASPSAVRNFICRLEEEGGSTQTLTGVAIACIGPTTLEVAHECHLSEAFMPQVYTLDHLVHRLEEYFDAQIDP